MTPIPQTTTKPVAEVRPPWEAHYTVAELARMWRIGRTTARKWVEDEPDVVRFGESRIRRGRRRPYVSLRIPQSVAERVYRRHLEKG